MHIGKSNLWLWEKMMRVVGRWWWWMKNESLIVVSVIPSTAYVARFWDDVLKTRCYVRNLPSVFVTGIVSNGVDELCFRSEVPQYSKLYCLLTEVLGCRQLPSVVTQQESNQAVSSLTLYTTAALITIALLLIYVWIVSCQVERSPQVREQRQRLNGTGTFTSHCTSFLVLFSVLDACTDIIKQLWLKVGFHYPSSRAELTARELGCIFLTPVNSGSGNRTPVYTGRVHGRPVSKKCTRVLGPSTGPWTRAVNSGSGNRPLVVKKTVCVFRW